MNHINWYKIAGLLMPDANLVQWMAQQVKPYLQTLSTNKRIKELKQKVSDLESSLSYNNNVLKDPNYLQRTMLFSTDWSPELKKKHYERRTKEIQEETPVIREKLIAAKEMLKMLIASPKVKFESIRTNPTGEISVKVPEEVIPEDLVDLMSDHRKSGIKLLMHYNISGAAGTYNQEPRWLEVDVDLMDAVRKKDPYNHVIQVITHELDHNIQHLRGTDEFAYGSPPKGSLTPEYTNEGYWDLIERKKQGEASKYHGMIDTEFYPKLSSRAIAIDTAKANGKLDISWFKDFIKKDGWLEMLKERAPQKYQKAVNELLKHFQS